MASVGTLLQVTLIVGMAPDCLKEACDLPRIHFHPIPIIFLQLSGTNVISLNLPDSCIGRNKSVC